MARQALLFPALQYDAEGKSSLKDALKLTTLDESALNRGLVIQVNSVFEFFMRSLIDLVTGHIAKTADTFSKTDKNFQNQFLAHAGRIMNCIPAGNVSGQSFDFKALLNSVRNCIADESPYQIYSSVFSVQMGNCTPERVEKLFGILGLSEPFSDDLGRNVNLQRVLIEKSHRRVAASARDKLGKEIDLRNDIVHGQLVRAVSSTDVQQSAAFFRALMIGLSEKVEKELAS